MDLLMLAVIGVGLAGVVTIGAAWSRRQRDGPRRPPMTVRTATLQAIRLGPVRMMAAGHLDRTDPTATQAAAIQVAAMVGAAMGVVAMVAGATS